jgi:hypothetical protein
MLGIGWRTYPDSSGILRLWKLANYGMYWKLSNNYYWDHTISRIIWNWMVESHHYLELGSCNPPMHIAKVLFPNHFKDPSATLNAHLTTRVIYPLWSYKTWCSFQFCLGKSMIISNHKKLALLFSLKTSLMTLSRFYCTITPHFFRWSSFLTKMYTLPVKNVVFSMRWCLELTWPPLFRGIVV